MAKKKEKDERKPAPDSPWERESDARDGVSGNWS